RKAANKLNSDTPMVAPGTDSGGARPLVWLTAVRDHPGRPRGRSRCFEVLTMLALRLDWGTGTGYASTGQLMADTGAGERTVRRALDWAQQAGLLVRTRRGHRLGNGQVIASEWALALPSQPVTKAGLSGESQQATTDGLRNVNRPIGASQP